MKVLIDILHILLCHKQHSYNMMELANRSEKDCYYYLENDISDGNLMPDHATWEVITEKVKISLGFETDEETLEFIREIIRLSQEIQELSNGNNLRLQFIQSILK